MRIHNITYPDVNNGLGCRVTLWVAGCSHHCKGCQNKETWDFSGGREFLEEDKSKLFEVLSLPYIKGITLSGGDPLDSVDDCYKLLTEIKEKFPTKDVWVYTGYTLEELENDDKRNIILPLIDILVDGKFEIEQRDITLAFRGSKNQIIWKNENGKFTKSDLN